MVTIVQCVNNMDLGGVEQLVLTLARQFRARGFGSLICCIEDRGVLADRAEADGIAVHPLHAGQRGQWRALRDYCRLVRGHHPVVLHSHNFKPFYYSALATLFGAADGHIHTRHGSLLRHHPAAWRYRLLRRWVDAWVTVSTDRQNELADRTGLPKNRIHVLANGVDTALFCPATDKGVVRTELGLPENSPLIVCVARLAPEKDLATLLRAFQIVLDQSVGTDRRAVRTDDTTHGAPGRRALPHLLLVGDGPEQGRLETIARELGVADHTRFLGQRSDTHKFLQAADVFALSSLSEGLSVALLEAAACGLLIVATDVGGNPEVVNAPHGGRLVPPANPPALAAALIEVLGDDKLRAAMRVAARQHVQAKFTLDKMVTGYLELYQRALVSRGRSPGSAP